MFQHHLVRPSGFRVSGTVWRGRGDNVGSPAGGLSIGRGGARRDKDSRDGVGHIFDCRASLDKVVERLSGGVVVFLANAIDVLLKAFVEGIEDGVRRSQFEGAMGG